MDMLKPPRHLTEPVRKALRTMVQGELLLQSLGDILDALDTGTVAQRAPDGTLVHRPLDKEDIARLKASADIKLALLRKVLPDLKVIEIKEDSAGGGSTPRRMSDMELASRLVRFYRDEVKPAQLDAPPPDWAS